MTELLGLMIDGVQPIPRPSKTRTLARRTAGPLGRILFAETLFDVGIAQAISAAFRFVGSAVASVVK